MTLLQVAQTPPPPGVDPNRLIEQLIPLLGVIGVAIVLALTVRWLFKSPMAEAMAERMRARMRSRLGETGEGDERIAGLEHQVVTLQGQLTELAERVDFAERLLAERRERKLSAGQ